VSASFQAERRSLQRSLITIIKHCTVQHRRTESVKCKVLETDEWNIQWNILMRILQKWENFSNQATI
jgi:hypothetical protein